MKDRRHEDASYFVVYVSRRIIKSTKRTSLGMYRRFLENKWLKTCIGKLFDLLAFQTVTVRFVLVFDTV